MTFLSLLPLIPFLLAALPDSAEPSVHFIEETQSALPSRADLKALTRTIAEEEGLDPDLFEALIAAESDFQIHAVSPKGAKGLAQLMPATADAEGVAPKQIFDPETNLRAGARHFKDCLDDLGSVEKALAAYNAGAYRAKRPFRTWPPETRAYVVRIFSRTGIAAEDPGLIAALNPSSQIYAENDAGEGWIGDIVSMRRAPTPEDLPDAE